MTAATSFCFLCLALLVLHCEASLWRSPRPSSRSEGEFINWAAKRILRTGVSDTKLVDCSIFKWKQIPYRQQPVCFIEIINSEDLVSHFPNHALSTKKNLTIAQWVLKHSEQRNLPCRKTFSPFFPEKSNSIWHLEVTFIALL